MNANRRVSTKSNQSNVKYTLNDLPIDIFSVIAYYFPKYDLLHTRSIFLISKNITEFLTMSSFFWSNIILIHYPRQYSDILVHVSCRRLSHYCLYRGRCEGEHFDKFDEFRTRREIFDGNFEKSCSSCPYRSSSDRFEQIEGEMILEFHTDPINQFEWSYDSSHSRMKIFNHRQSPDTISFSKLRYLYHYDFRGFGDHVWGYEDTDLFSSYILWLDNMKRLEITVEFRSHEPNSEECQPDYAVRYFVMVYVNKMPLLVSGDNKHEYFVSIDLVKRLYRILQLNGRPRDDNWTVNKVLNEITKELMFCVVKNRNSKSPGDCNLGLFAWLLPKRVSSDEIQEVVERVKDKLDSMRNTKYRPNNGVICADDLLLSIFAEENSSFVH